MNKFNGFVQKVCGNSVRSWIFRTPSTESERELSDESIPASCSNYSVKMIFTEDFGDRVKFIQKIDELGIDKVEACGRKYKNKTK